MPVFLHPSCEKCVPVEPDVDPRVDQAVECHQPEEGLHLQAYLGPNVGGTQVGQQLSNDEWG